MGEAGTTETLARQSERRTLPWWKKALFGSVTVALSFGLLELILLIVGVDAAGGGDDPFVGFSARIPHFEIADGRVRRPSARETVMNEFDFPAVKPPGTTRIFCVGGSTTYGRPFWDDTSFAGYLGEMLPQACNGAAFEVINAGAMSYASYRVVGVMREAAELEPDAFVVLTGHNEFLERRTYAAIHEMSPFVRETAALLVGTRTGSLIRQLAGATARPPEGLGEDVQRVAINAVGPEAYRRNDAWRDEVVAEFAVALHGMVDIAEAAGARIVFVVPVANARDCPPFKSEASDELAPANVATFLGHLEAGRQALRAGRGQDAVDALREATELDPRYAEAWYLLGRALLDAGDLGSARAALERALEEDVCALRSSAAIQQAVRDVATARGVPAVEFATLVDEPGGIGVNAFADHVHPWPAANARLAAALVTALGDAGAVTVAERWDAAQAEAATARVDARVDREKHGNELIRLTFVLMSLDKPELAHEIAERAVPLLGGGSAALLAAAGALEAGGDPQGALGFAARAEESEPTSAAVLCRHGTLLKGAGDAESARRRFTRALEIDQDSVDAHAHLGVLDAHAGNLSSAEAHFREVVRLRPNMADSHYNLALALLRQDKTREAEAALAEAVRIDPEHAEATKRLGALRR